MDDQQGEVIDGTARASQWRRSRSKAARPSDERAQDRSDAPKSIAASLLVPADMLPAPLPSDRQLNRDEQSRASERSPDPEPVTPERASSEDTRHQNPFLVAEAAGAATAGQGAGPAHRRLTAALLTRSADVMQARRKLSRAPRGPAGVHRRRLDAVRLAGPVVVVLAVGAVALTAVILTQSQPTHPSPVQAGPSDGSATSRNPLESGPFAAKANPSGRPQPARGHASTGERRVRAHRASVKHNRPRPAIKAAAVPARYTPPASSQGTSAPAAPTQSYASSGSAAAPAQPAASAGASDTTSASSSSTSSRPPFGQDGILGPGHSPNS
jgi:hypothetical protein